MELTEPVAQVWQAMAGLDEKVPAAQPMHAVELKRLYVPVVQVLHGWLGLAVYCPAAQVVQPVALARLKLPPTHG